MNQDKIFGVTHVAVPAHNLSRAVNFYCSALGFSPFDTSDHDWAMVHLGQTSVSFFQVPSNLDGSSLKSDSKYRHFGITVPSAAEVDEWHGRLQKEKSVGFFQSKDLGQPKVHRDGSYGFYLQDSEGNALEIIWIPEKSSRASAKSAL